MNFVGLARDVRALGCASSFLVVACGPDSGSDDNGNSESGDDTGQEGPGSGTDDDTPLDSTGADSSGGDESTAPDCPAVMCGDGIVGLNEPCDDANTDDADGCTIECTRPTPTVVATTERGSQVAAFDADGSVVLVEFTDDALVRLAPDGTELWRASLGSGGQVVALALHIGTEIVVVGRRAEGDGFEGSTWRFAPDGTPNGRVDDGEARDYIHGTLAANGDTVVLVGPTSGGSIERHAPDGTVVWSRGTDATTVMRSIALTTEEVVIAVGGDGFGGAALFRVTEDTMSTTTLAPPGAGKSGLDVVISDDAGGAIAAGVSTAADYTWDELILAGIDADGDVSWSATCSATGVVPGGITLAGQGVLVYGHRWADEPDCGDTCAGAFASWVQHFAPDGSVIAQDALGGLDDELQYPFEKALAVRVDEAGELSAVVSSQTSKSFLARFPR